MENWMKIEPHSQYRKICPITVKRNNDSGMLCVIKKHGLVVYIESGALICMTTGKNIVECIKKYNKNKKNKHNKINVMNMIHESMSYGMRQ